MKNAVYKYFINHKESKNKFQIVYFYTLTEQSSRVRKWTLTIIKLFNYHNVFEREKCVIFFNFFFLQTKVFWGEDKL